MGCEAKLRSKTRDLCDRYVEEDKKEKPEGQDGTVCGLHSQDGLQCQDEGQSRWTLGAGMPKVRKMVKKNKT